MSRKTVKILTECIMCTILTIAMLVGSVALYWMNKTDDPRETPKEQNNK